MKIIIILFASIICTTYSYSQSKPIPDGSQCPFGYIQTGVSWSIDKLSLHKPRTGCTIGFGLCIETTTFLVCANGYNTVRVPYIKENRVYGSIVVRNGVVELHLPLDLRSDPAFENEDLSIFFIEDRSLELIFEGHEESYFVPEGQYPVIASSEALIVKISF